MSPAEALEAIGRVREAVEAVLASQDPDAIAALLAEMAPDVEALQAIKPADPDDADWAEVATALDELRAWLAEPAPNTKAGMSRDERLKLAVGIASRGRANATGLRRDAADMILDGFYGGLGVLIRASAVTLRVTARLAGRATLAAGDAIGRGVQAGAVHVDAYIRADGARVPAHDRDAPKAAPGAHYLYR